MRIEESQLFIDIFDARVETPLTRVLEPLCRNASWSHFGPGSSIATELQSCIQSPVLGSASDYLVGFWAPADHFAARAAADAAVNAVLEAM